MSVTRIMGIETEYGVSSPGHPHANSMLMSGQVVAAYDRATHPQRNTRTRWDYEVETPLRDARGFDMSKAEADPSQLTDDDVGMANVILTNGARLYVDHAHPEYSTPEVLTPREAVLYDRAGQQIMARAARLASSEPGAREIRLYKNNTDNKGASYGCHENYLMPRTTAFPSIVSALIPFFVSRQVIAGAGRVGIGQDGRISGYQITQRADFFEVEVGLETTLKRPIINTRDEPHADPEQYRRLHVIVGDANLSEYATYLKLGITSLILSMVEHGWDFSGFRLRHPVRQLHQVSHDPDLRYQMELSDGRRLSAVQMQADFADQARKFVDDRFGSDADDPTLEILREWETTVDALHRDPAELVTSLDWLAKRALLDGYRRRDRLEYGDARLDLVDLQYSDVDPARGLWAKLEQRGRLRRLTTDEQVENAVQHAPESTRAYFRGECLRRYPQHVTAASWDSVIFDVPGHSALQRVPTLDPLRGTKTHVQPLLEASPTATDLIKALQSLDG
ncbi:MAG TPA: depupylase/deamidase Dop [Actinomycetota bacterium]|nr:depupylase/deamidase Dop [Actinomycetota bacterium]